MVIDAAVGKAVASGTKLAFGWLSGPARRKIADARAAGRLDENGPTITELGAAFSALEPSEASAVAEYIQSAEVANIVYKIATKLLLRSHGAGADAHDQRIGEELRAGLELTLPLNPMNLVLAELLHRALVQSVQSNFRIITPDDQGGISPAARAAIIRSAADMTTAAGTNLMVLGELSSLSAVDSFEHQYCAAVTRLNSKMRLPHAGTSRQVPYDELFVQPSLGSVLLESETHENQAFSLHEIDDDKQYCESTLADVASICQRFVLLGDPGGGKTTTSSHFLHQVASGNAPQLIARVPFWITLRDFASRFDSGISISEYIEEHCRTQYSIDPPTNAIEYILLNGRGIVFFDGLDELLETSHRQKVVQAVEGFATRYATASIVVTSRKIGYIEAALDEDMFTSVELGPFTDGQIEAYAAKWFKLDDSIEQARETTVTEAFMSDSAFVRDLTSNPLMLSLMCGIYAFENYIPRNRPDVYERCALLLFEKWDKQRGIGGEMSFDAHVQSAIRSIAFSLYSTGGSDKTLPRHQLIEHVKNYLLHKRFDDEVEAEQAATEFIDFCKGRAWVLTDLGAEVYGFTHRTFLEYFTASHLVRAYPNADSLLDELYERLRKSEWDVVAQLAVQILGKTVDDGSDDFLDSLIDRAVVESETQIQGNLISFALRALNFIVPRPVVLRKVVDAVVDYHCSLTVNISNREVLRRDNLSADLVTVSSENRPLVSKYFLEKIKGRLASDPYDQRALALAWYLSMHAYPALADNGAEYWKSKVKEYQEDLRNYLEVQSEVCPWAASILVLASALDVKAMISKLGVRSLYDLNVAGDILVAPIAYLITSSGRGYQVPKHVAKAVYEELLVEDRPWFDSTESFDIVGYDYFYLAERPENEMMTSEGRIYFSAATICWLAIVELELLHRADSENSSPESDLRSFPGRSRAECLDKIKSLIHRITEFEVPHELLRFVEQWAAEEFNLIEHVASRSEEGRTTSA